MAPEAGRWRLPLLAGLFLLSGAASLMDQVVWLRYLSLTFGNTTYAAATLLAVFMGGLGLGALLFGRWADRIGRPLTLYALLEVGIGLAAILSPSLFDLIGQTYVALYRTWGNQPLLFAAGRACLAALFLLPPTLLMGGTLPLVLRAATREEGEVGRTSAVLYAVNTLGAVMGVGLAGFASIRLLGLYPTLLVAAGLNLAAAIGCLALSRPRLPSRAPAAAPAGIRPWLLALFFAMGATSLAYEVLWTRILVFYLGSSVYAYSLMLAIFLLGVGAGSLLAAPWADRVPSPLGCLAALELGIGGLALLQVALFQGLNRSLLAVALRIEPQAFPGLAATQFLALLPVLGPPTLLMGLSFPVAVRALNRELGQVGADVGAVYGANTLGAVLGSLAAGFVLIPLLGTQDSLLTVGAANALLGAGILAVRPLGRAGRWRWLAAPAPAAVLLGLWLFPPDRVILAAGIFRHDDPEDLVHFEEDASASVTIRRLEHPAGPYLSLELNGVNVAGTSPDLYAIQKMQGHLPMLLARDPQRILHVGFGSGGTAHAVSVHPAAEILVVEISPAVLRAADRFFAAINRGVLADPRLEVEINDGRNFLLATPETFDAILSDSIHPRYAGNGSLYTREYFQLVRRRLAPGGAVSMWLPMYSLTPRNYAMILRAFVEVFPEAAVWYEPSSLNSFTVVTGRAEPGAWSRETLRRAFAEPQVARELADLGISGPADVLACYLAGSEDLAPWLARVPPHVDDLPAVEYESGLLIQRDWTWLENFSILLELRPRDPPAAYLAALPPAERQRAIASYRQRQALLADQRRALAEILTGRSPAGGP